MRKRSMATMHLNSTCPSSLKRRPTALKTTTPIFIFCTIFH
ncbi:unnamed protein product [Brassica oleracea]